MNPATGAPWALSEAARAEILRVLRRDKDAGNWHLPAVVALIDKAAAEYRRLIGDQFPDRGRRTLEAEAQRRPDGFAAAALAFDERATASRGRGRPTMTRERWALVHAIRRALPGMMGRKGRHGALALSPKSTFVQILGVALHEIDPEIHKDAYKFARRVLGEPPPPVTRLEPAVMADLLRGREFFAQK
ncbi:hypothetical protein [Zeimonas arvi]|uniref:Uncharacterized protein n=1 Tax=Zeimonas arvi TaxID=2498847 RepID=A0A5C8NMP3_9BURK|nr:hypothetical protein [Zeimonas arvi]TXL62458.1 hypothetical protein FHP08_18010 [Zeimonas arvi]